MASCLGKFRQLTRRELLRDTAAIGLIAGTGALLAACGQGAAPQSAAASPSSKPASSVAPSQPATKPAPPAAGEAQTALIAELGGSDLIAAAKKEGQLVWYTADSIDVAQERKAAFEKAYPEIKMELVPRGGGELDQLIRTEVAAKKFRGDVIGQSNVALLIAMQKNGLLEEYTPPSDSHYPDKIKVKGWIYPVSLTLHNFIYNTKAVSPADAPKDWPDLLNPRWKGRIAITSASAGGASFTLGMFQRKTYGLDYWTQLAAQQPHVIIKNANLIQTVISGENLVGTMLDTEAKVAIKKGAPIKFVFPPGGTPVVPLPQTIAKGASHPNAAKLFQNWTLSSAGQQFLRTEIGGWSGRDDIPAPEADPPRESIKFWYYDIDEFQELNKPWGDEWNKVFNFTP